jgi:hypothetical protein
LNRSFHIPPPAITAVDLSLSPHAIFQAFIDDFHMSFQGFLQPILPPELQISRSAIETNRCFFLHLGIATGIHPFLLQASFRAYASHLLSIHGPEAWFADLLTSVIQYAGFVDANVLSIIWPKELNNYRILFISGIQKPILTSFIGYHMQDQVEQLSEIIIHCNGSHFVLLRPRLLSNGQPVQRFHIISKLLQEAKKNHLTVQENIAMDTTENQSVFDCISSIFQSRR